MYLAAVRGLACLADRYTAQVVPALCRQFTGGGRHTDAETRLKLAEALVLMVRNLGETAAGTEGRGSLGWSTAGGFGVSAKVCRVLEVLFWAAGRDGLGMGIWSWWECLSSSGRIGFGGSAG